MPRWIESAPNIMRWGHVETTARVRWGECDSQGHAYYGSYIPWFDLGRETYALEVGVEFWKYKIATTEFQVRYHAPARYLDDLVIKTWAITPIVQLKCYYEIYRKQGGQLIAEAHSCHVVVDPAGGLRMRAPRELHDRFEKFLADKKAAITGTGTS